MPSFSLLQKDSSMQTPGYGDAPEVRITFGFRHSIVIVWFVD